MYGDQLFMKSPVTGTAQPWHQDSASWRDIFPMDLVTAWTAIDDATLDNGCLRFVPGTHRWGMLSGQRLSHFIDDLETERWPAVPVPVRAGGISFHHSLTLHTSKNTSPTRRRAYAIHYMRASSWKDGNGDRRSQDAALQAGARPIVPRTRLTAPMSERLTLRTPRPPNVLWIFGDQHRAHATSYRGDRNVFTPNIDNLAREGMRFDCAVAGAPWCTPFRGALLSGRYPHQTGVIRTPRRWRRRSPPWPTPSAPPATTPPTSASGTSTAATTASTTCLRSGAAASATGWATRTTTTSTSATCTVRPARRRNGCPATRPTP